MTQQAKQKAQRVRCPECGQMVLTYLSSKKGRRCLKGHCRPGTDPRKSIGCDCPGSYVPDVTDRNLTMPEGPNCPKCGTKMGPQTAPPDGSFWCPSIQCGYHYVP